MSGEDRKMQLRRIEAARWTGDLRFVVAFDEGTKRVIDLEKELPVGSHARLVIVSDPGGVAIAPRGRALVWQAADGREVDLDAETVFGLSEVARIAAE